MHRFRVFVVVCLGAVALSMVGCTGGSTPSGSGGGTQPSSEGGEENMSAAELRRQRMREAAQPRAEVSKDDAMASIEGLAEVMHPDIQPAEPVEGDWLLLHMGGEPNSLNPLFMSSTVEFNIIGLIFEGALAYDFNQSIIPSMYQSWEPSEDYKVVTVKLAEDRQWSDGTPVTAHDFHFGWEQAKDPAIPAMIWRDDALKFESVEVLDDYTLRLTYKEPTARWESDLALPLVPKHLFEQYDNAADFEASEYNRMPVVNGPYKVESWKTQDSITLARNENYTGPHRPYFDKIVFKHIPNSSVALSAFLTQDVDNVTSMRPSDLVNKVKDPNFQELANVKIRSTPGYTYIGWNMDGSNPFFEDKRVRHAMTFACNREKMREVVFLNMREVSNGNFHPDQWFANPDVEPFPFDLDKARELLTEAGWVDSDGDGIRDKEGVPFEFELIMPQGNVDGERIAVMYQSDLEKVGVKMQLRPMEWATQLETVQDTKNFVAYLAGWGGGFFPETSYNIWHSSMHENGRNYVKYNNPRVDEIMDRGRYEFDPEKQTAMYQEAQALIYEDQPYTFLHFSNQIYVHHRRIQGVRMSLYGPYRYNPGLMGWWVPKEMQQYP